MDEEDKKEPDRLEAEVELENSPEEDQEVDEIMDKEDKKEPDRLEADIELENRQRKTRRKKRDWTKRRRKSQTDWRQRTS